LWGFVLLISYFLFKDGENIKQKIVGWLPIRRKTGKKLIDQFEKVTYAVVYGQLFVALAQGFIGINGFYVFGVPFPFFWGVMMAFFSMVPPVGTAVFGRLLLCNMVLTGYLTNDYITLSKGIGLFVYGLLIITTIDEFLRIKIIQAKAECAPNNCNCWSCRRSKFVRGYRAVFRPDTSAFAYNIF
jgi:predicted PurR-regulated permease PerM